MCVCVLCVRAPSQGDEATSKRHDSILSAQHVYTARWSLHSSVLVFHAIPRGAPRCWLWARSLASVCPDTPCCNARTRTHAHTTITAHAYFRTHNCTFCLAFLKARQGPAGDGITLLLLLHSSQGITCSEGCESLGVSQFRSHPPEVTTQFEINSEFKPFSVQMDSPSQNQCSSFSVHNTNANTNTVCTVQFV